MIKFVQAKVPAVNIALHTTTIHIKTQVSSRIVTINKTISTEDTRDKKDGIIEHTESSSCMIFTGNNKIKEWGDSTNKIKGKKWKECSGKPWTRLWEKILGSTFDSIHNKLEQSRPSFEENFRSSNVSGWKDSMNNIANIRTRHTEMLQIS